MPRLADVKRFVGYEAAYATQHEDGRYTYVPSPLTDTVLQAHLDGNVTVGTYTLNFDKVRHFVFDDDTSDLGLVRKVELECRRLRLTPGVEWSGQKGYHVWVLLEDWTPAADVRRLARAIATIVGFNGEVFPKQDAVTKTGSLVKLPYGIHRKSKLRSRFIGPEPKPVSSDAFEAALASEARVVPAGDERSAPSSAFVALPCLDNIQKNPPREGYRNSTLFKLAVHLRHDGTLDDASILSVLESICPRDQLDPGEMDRIVQSSANVSGGTTDCSTLPPDWRCPPELCYQTRDHSWRAQRPGEIKRAVDGEQVVFTVKHVENDVVELEHPDVHIARAALRTGD